MLQRARPARGPRARQAARARARQPGHRHGARATRYRELRDAVARCAGMLRRQGIEKGDRVIIYMPMVPEAVIAMLACARIGRDPLRGLRRLRAQRAGQAHRRRQAQADPLGLVRHRGQPASSPTSRCSIGAIELAQHKVRALRDPPAAAGDGAARARARSRLGRGAGRRPARRVRRRSPRPTRSTSSTPRAPPAFPRASCATTAATPWRSSGRMERVYGMGRGEDVLGRLRHRLGGRATRTSSTRRCSRAAPRSSTRASRWARPIPARSGVSSPSTA